ncbi:MAG: hypothetical protein HY747_12065 [Elusimicrobia bacterium]|nr:hypothetical protein [Elusimicrobiota bacterium]
MVITKSNNPNDDAPGRKHENPPGSGHSRLPPNQKAILPAAGFASGNRQDGGPTISGDPLETRAVSKPFQE